MAMAQTPRTRGIAFIKASSKQQINQQKQNIFRFACNREIEIEKCFEANKLANNNLLGQILYYRKKNPDIKYLVINSADRLSRSLSEYTCLKNELAQNGITVLVATESDSTVYQNMLNILAFFSEQEYEGHRVRIKKALKQTVSNGYSIHRPPLGYSKTAKKGLYKINSKGRTLYQYCNDTLSGKMNRDELHKAISEMLHPTRKLDRSRMRQMLSNPYCCGLVHFDGKHYTGLHQPLLTRQEQRDLLELLD